MADRTLGFDTARVKQAKEIEEHTKAELQEGARALLNEHFRLVTSSSILGQMIDHMHRQMIPERAGPGLASVRANVSEAYIQMVTAYANLLAVRNSEKFQAVDKVLRDGGFGDVDYIRPDEDSAQGG